MTLNGKEYRELAAIPANRPFVSHMKYTDDQGRRVTLFPAFRSADGLDQVSRIQSPVKLNTLPVIYRRNDDQYENTYHELVKEYGPKKNEPGSLFLFGRDEVFTSESTGNMNLKPEKPQPPLRLSVTPNPPPAPPIKNLDISPYPKNHYFRSQTVPRMRYIYAFPEEFRDIVEHQNQLPVEISRSDEVERKPLPKRGISFEKEHSPSSMLDELKSRLSQQESHSSTTHSSVKTLQRERKSSRSTSERKAERNSSFSSRTQKPSLSEFYPIPRNLQPARSTQQKSPDTLLSTTNASNFSYKPIQRSVSHESVIAPEPVNPDIAQFLKDTPAHIRPLVKNFISSQFENPQKELDHTEWSETEIPMKHYWQKVFKVKEGKKTATIKIENLLSIEPEIGPFHGFVSNNENDGSIQKQISENSFKKESERRISIDSGTLSAESGFSSSPHQQRSPESSPRWTESDMDLLTVVLRKIRQRKPIDWPELFLLKNDHCRFVVNREKELKKLKKMTPVPSEATLLERDIVDNYRGYQRALEQAVVVDELYTRLAYLIMRAESYWYAAKVTSDQTLRHHFYALARHNYGDLLIEAKVHLDPDDKSLLTILDKMTQILMESNVSDPDIVGNCKRAVFEAEKALESRPDVKKERRIIKIKNNLILLR